MNVCVLGTGYVGLVVGVCMSDRGFSVTCVDTNKAKIDGLHNGVLPIYEPGLDELVLRNVESGRLTFTTDGSEPIKQADVIYIAVGTPSSDDGSADLRWVHEAAVQIAEFAQKGSIVIIKSTVPVGTSDQVRAILEANNAEVEDVVSNPEFLREGAAIGDFITPDRIVVGHKTAYAKAQVETLYASFITAGCPVLFMDNRSAEITKYASNALLATKISFANELARLCDAVGADIDSVRQGTGADSRIGPKFLYAGVGYGGSCFPKDVKALIHAADRAGVQLRIVRAVEEVNAEQKRIIVRKICHHFGDDLTGKHFGLWGLAFKPETDDIREAPALYIVPELIERGATVSAFDPEAMSHIEAVLGHLDGLTLVSDAEQAIAGADALVLLTEWQQFREPDWSAIRSILKGNQVFDGRNIFSPPEVMASGLGYTGIGRGVV